jgi:hypothetical protein
MNRKWVQLATLCCSAVALLCWIVMFLAGTDIWHDAGRPDFWTLQGPTHHDVRGFAYAFYLLFIVLSVQLIATGLGFLTARARRQG